MATYDLYSKRQKRLRGEVPDIYTYDDIPNPLRVQIIHIWWDTLGRPEEYSQIGLRGSFNGYEYIIDTLCREYGVFRLADKETFVIRNYLEELVNFFLKEEAPERVLDAIEVSFRVIDHKTRDYWYLQREDSSERADAGIKELNARFQEHGVGFQFIDGDIVRIDSQLIHTEVVKPALALLHGDEYAGAQAEFLKAYEHYRHGNTKETLNECLKVLESTLKVICDKRKWKYQPQATCSTLIQVCIDNGLIPTFWTQHFSALRSTLETGVPAARNKLGGHGQGSTIVDVPLHLVAYVLHLTAACVVFLVESERALK